MRLIFKRTVLFSVWLFTLFMCTTLLSLSQRASANNIPPVTLSGGGCWSPYLCYLSPYEWTAPTTGTAYVTYSVDMAVPPDPNTPWTQSLSTWVSTISGPISPIQTYENQSSINFPTLDGTNYYINLSGGALDATWSVTIYPAQPTPPTPAHNPDLIIRIKGPAGLSNMLPSIANAMFFPGTITRISDGNNGKTFQAYYGYVYGNGKNGIFQYDSQSTQNFGGLNNALITKNVLLVANFDDNAANTYNVMTNNIAIPFMSVNNACAAISGAIYPNATYNCTGVANATVDIGLADVEDTVILDNDVPSGFRINPANDSANLSETWLHDAVLGVAVTNNVPITSLSKAQLASIFDTDYTDWNNVSSSSFPIPGVNPIIIEDYTNGSGTDTFSYAYLLNYPCGDALNGSIPPWPYSAFGDPVNFSTNTLVKNQNGFGVASGLNSVYAKGKRGIGILSTEIQPQSTDNWHFISLAGAAPTVANAASGASDFFVERTILTQNYPTRKDTYATSIPDIAAAITTVLSTPANLWALPGVGIPALNVDVTSPAVKPYLSSVFLSTRFQNSCSPAQLYPLSSYP